MPTVRVTEVETPLGEMVAAATDQHLVLLEYTHRRTIAQQIDRAQRGLGALFEPGETPVLDVLRVQLAEYFRGDRTAFDIPLHTPGTPFQTRVWDALLQIPVGTTTSYGRLAASIGAPDAVRAVARANGDNRIAIIIPCHRVIGADGSLTGYGGGLWRKKKLLELEARTQELSLF